MQCIDDLNTSPKHFESLQSDTYNSFYKLSTFRVVEPTPMVSSSGSVSHSPQLGLKCCKLLLVGIRVHTIDIKISKEYSHSH